MVDQGPVATATFRGDVAQDGHILLTPVVARS